MKKIKISLLLFILGISVSESMLVYGAAEQMPNGSVAKLPIAEEHMAHALDAIGKGKTKAAHGFLVEAALHDHEMACRYLARSYKKGILTSPNPIMQKYFEDWAYSIVVQSKPTGFGQHALPEGGKYLLSALEAVRHGRRSDARRFLTQAACAGHEIASRYLVRSYDLGGILTRPCHPLKQFFEDLANSIAAPTNQSTKKTDFLEWHINGCCTLSLMHRASLTLRNALVLTSETRLQIVQLFAEGKIPDESLVNSNHWFDSSVYQSIFDYLRSTDENLSKSLSVRRCHRLVWLIKEWAYLNGKKAEWIELCQQDFELMLNYLGRNYDPAKKEVCEDFMNKLRYYFQCLPRSTIEAFTEPLVKVYINYFGILERDTLIDVCCRASSIEQLFVRIVQELVIRPLYFNIVYDETFDLMVKCALKHPGKWQRLEMTQLSTDRVIRYALSHVEGAAVYIRACINFFKHGTSLHEQYKDLIIQTIPSCVTLVDRNLNAAIMNLVNSNVPEIAQAVVIHFHEHV